MSTTQATTTAQPRKGWVRDANDVIVATDECRRVRRRPCGDEGMSAGPCATCPWRKSSTVGGADIPNFDIDLMRRLSNTVGEGDAFRPVIACHYSACGEETPCLGYVAVEGWSNLAVRVRSIRGQLDIGAVMDASAGIDLWPSFGEMLRAYEDAGTVA